MQEIEDLISNVEIKELISSGTEVQVDDTQKNVQKISFYNFTTDPSDSSWLKPGMIALIKEPHMKYSAKTKKPIIRVDSPSGLHDKYLYWKNV